MKNFWRITALSLALTIAIAAALSLRSAHPATAMDKMYPSAGYTIHVDAIKHFPGNRSAVAHHFCRPAAGGILECQLYASDKPDARLVGVEVIVPAAMWKTFDKTEQARWHYHRWEIPRVNARMPDVSKAEAAKTVASLMETYGKVYLLWDPTSSNAPTGNPQISIVH